MEETITFDDWLWLVTEHLAKRYFKYSELDIFERINLTYICIINKNTQYERNTI